MAERPLPAYAGDEAYIFVTYAHEDAGLVFPHIRWLQEQGFNVWWDEGISPGAAWRSELAEAISGCSLLLYFITPQSVVSEHCTREVNFALDEHHRPVLAVHLVETSLPGALALSLSDRQAILLHALEPEDYERKLVSAVATYLDQPLPEISLRSPSRKSKQQAAWFLTASCSFLVVGVASLVTWLVIGSEPPSSRALIRFPLDLPTGVALPAVAYHPFAISQDGRRIVFSGGDRLYVRSLDDLEASPIRGTEGVVSSLYLSPDGESVIFHDVTNQVLKKVRVGGGVPVTIVRGGLANGLSWGRDGTITFSNYATLMRTSDAGGTPEPLTRPMEGEFQGNPYVVGDGSAVLFDVAATDADTRIDVLSLVTGERRTLIDGSDPWVTSSGHLLFAKDGSIWAVPFNIDRLEIAGMATPVLEDVSIESNNARVSISTDGSMVYLPAEQQSSDTLVWIDLDGNETSLPSLADAYLQPRFSPDGRHVAFRMPGDEHRLWIYSVERNTFTKLTDIATFDHIWSPDGTMIMYTRGDGTGDLYWRNADGTGVEERLTTRRRNQYATSWSLDDREVVLYECDALQACDLGQLALTGERSVKLFLETEFNESQPALSADGQWIAYESDRSGRYEIYVQPYPDIDSGRWVISIDGGRHPLWSRDGRTLYYSAGSEMDRQMMSVVIETSPKLVAGTPIPLFNFKQRPLLEWRNHDLHPDGQRFLMVKPNPSSGIQRLIYVHNWLEEVKGLVPTD